MREADQNIIPESVCERIREELLEDACLTEGEKVLKKIKKVFKKQVSENQ